MKTVWTTDKEKKLIALRNEGKTYLEISQIMGLTHSAVSVRSMLIKRRNERIKWVQKWS